MFPCDEQPAPLALAAMSPNPAIGDLQHAGEEIARNISRIAFWSRLSTYALVEMNVAGFLRDQCMHLSELADVQVVGRLLQLNPLL